MSKLYGYKEKDVINFSSFLKKRKNKSLSDVFEEYANILGKSKGTIRNMYYAMAKKAKTDRAFKEKYLNNENFIVNKADEFSDSEFKKMLTYILSAKKQGKSVRQATGELAKGDIKLALRYQNKYRNAIKKDSRVKEIVDKLNTDKSMATKIVKNIVPETVFNKLKEEINGLVNKIALKEKEQNEGLKNRIFALEMENLRLNSIINEKEKINSINYFNADKKEDVIS